MPDGRVGAALTKWLLALAALVLSAALLLGAWREYRAFVLREAAQVDLGVARLERALDRLQQAERLVPGSARVQSEIGRVQLMLARWRDDPSAADAALRSHRAAIALNPRDATLYGEYGWALMRLERPAEALAAFDGALAHDPFNVYYLSSVGRAYEALGDSDAALAAYRRSLEVLPTRAVRDLVRALEGR